MEVPPSRRIINGASGVKNRPDQFPQPCDKCQGIEIGGCNGYYRSYSSNHITLYSATRPIRRRCERSANAMQRSELTSLKVTGQYERVQLPTTLDELQNLAVSSSLAYTFSTLFNDEAAAALSTIRLLGDDESMSIETSIPRLAAITHRLVLLSIPAHSLRRSTALSRHPELLAVVLANITISRLTSFMNSLVYFHLFDHLRIVEITTTQDMEKLDMCARGLSELAEIIGDGHSGLVSIYLDHDLNPTDDSRFIGDTRYDALRGAINLLTTACKVNGIHVIFERQEYHTFPEDAYSEEFTRVQLEEDYGNYVTYWVH
ncbi:hypothetical protein JCM5353_000603 [Sporobolomyces roseus]